MVQLPKSISLALIALALAVATNISLSALDKKVEEQLKMLFPTATSFSNPEGKPPTFKAFATDAKGVKTPAGFAGYTTDWQPFERGYDGPIKILVGVNMTGFITEIVVVEHKEPYGYRSIDLQRFADQFTNKNIQDQFRLRGDIDMVSRATISVSSATRSIRDTARRLAEAYLPPGPVKK